MKGCQDGMAALQQRAQDRWRFGVVGDDIPHVQREGSLLVSSPPQSPADDFASIVEGDL